MCQFFEQTRLFHPGKGISHNCNKKTKIENIFTANNDVVEQIASKTLIAKKTTASSSMVELNKEHGIPLKVKILSSRNGNNIAAFPKPLAKDFVAEIKTASNMSEKNLKTFIATFRKTYGRKSVEAGIVETIRDSTHVLDEFFEQTYIESNNSNCLVYCNKLNDFVAFILNHRDCSEEIIVKVGADGGAGSLKICLTIQDCLSSSCSHKDSGVKKSFILAIAYGVPESFENLKIMFEKLNLNNFFSIMNYNDNVVVVGDMKIINLILGIFKILFVELSIIKHDLYI